MKIYPICLIIILIFIIGCNQLSPDSSICETQQNKDECFAKLSMDSNNFSFCSKITNQVLRTNCLEYTAMYTGNKEICEKLEVTSVNKELCKKKAEAFLSIQNVLKKQCKSLNEKNVDELISTFSGSMNIEKLREDWSNILNKAQLECQSLKISSLWYERAFPDKINVFIEADLEIKFNEKILSYKSMPVGNTAGISVFENSDGVWKDSGGIALLSFEIQNKLDI